jgi:hypothetical protein
MVPTVQVPLELELEELPELDVELEPKKLPELEDVAVPELEVELEDAVAPELELEVDELDVLPPAPPVEDGLVPSSQLMPPAQAREQVSASAAGRANLKVSS